MNFLCFFVMGWLSDLMIVTHVCIKCNHYVILSVRLLRIVESISFNDIGLAGLRCLSIPKSSYAGFCRHFNHHYPNRVSLGKRKELKSADYFHLATEDRYGKSSFRDQENFCSLLHMRRWKEDDPLDHPGFWFCPTSRE